MKAAKLALMVIILLVVVVLAAGAYLYKSGRLQSLVPPPSTVSQVHVQDVVSGTIVSVSDTTIAVQQSDGSKTTLALNSATRVESLVGTGEKGKTLAELTAGTGVALVLNEKDAHMVAIVSVVPEPPVFPKPTPEAIPANVVGVVESVSANNLTITDTTGRRVAVAVPEDVIVLTRVAAGEVGKSYSAIAVGDTVQISGLTSTDGFAATSIGILAAAQH